MARDFNELADRAKADWPDAARKVYTEASAGFAAELTERAELGSMLAAARKARSLTQPALSELTGIQQAEISRIERGTGNPTAATLLRLADALGQRVMLVPFNR
ncbi:helix-turn-helix domain-containing protein [Subtercola sp. Z020]|uniref:helix-turn-helix domain-containing protein n=1 Tax=Subtercola sp. Z020 TaxID=2080582 RepID=UPI003514589E